MKLLSLVVAFAACGKDSLFQTQQTVSYRVMKTDSLPVDYVNQSSTAIAFFAAVLSIKMMRNVCVLSAFVEWTEHFRIRPKAENKVYLFSHEIEY